MLTVIRNFYSFLKDIWSHRGLVLSLSKNDLKMRYASSFLGIVWAFLQPTVTIVVFWFVFEVGLKAQPVGDMPFIIWFLPAYIPWMYFSDGLLSTTNALYDYSYLIKKVKFRTSILPLVKLLSALFVHVFFLAILLLVILVFTQEFSLYYLQIIYYSFALTVLLVGLSWLMSSLAVFLKDLSQLVNVVVQIGFWLTPIFWNIDNLFPQLKSIFAINPMFYIVQGFRESLIFHVPFWHHPVLTAYFWMLAAALFIVGALTYQKLRPHFADSL